MKISLRKANALQLFILEQINEPFVGSVTVNKFDNPIEVIGNAGGELIHKIGVKFNLIQVLFSLRKKVGAKSAEVGIADLLTDLAENEKKAAFFRQLASSKPTAKTEVILAAVEDLKKEVPTASYYSRKESVEVSLLAKDAIESYAKSVVTLRKEKQALSDKLLHLNVSSEIELSKEEVAVLTNYNIL